MGCLREFSLWFDILSQIFLGLYKRENRKKKKKGKDLSLPFSATPWCLQMRLLKANIASESKYTEETFMAENMYEKSNYKNF